MCTLDVLLCQALFPGDLPASSVVRVARGPLVSRLTVAHHRFDVSYALQADNIDSLALPASFTMTTTASAEGNQEVTLAMQTDISNRDTFYSHNGWQFMRRKRTNVTTTTTHRSAHTATAQTRSRC